MHGNAPEHIIMAVTSDIILSVLVSRNVLEISDISLKEVI